MAHTLTDVKELSILISEDEPADHFLVRKAIGEISKEIDVNLVFSCEQLLDFLLRDKLQLDLNRQHLPDLIVANYTRPFCDLKIISDIRRRERFAHIPILVFVNESVTNTREKFLEYGVTAVLEKPQTYAGLKRELERFIHSLR
jgi:CheY-like chemotaxis protein